MEGSLGMVSTSELHLPWILWKKITSIKLVGLHLIKSAESIEIIEDSISCENIAFCSVVILPTLFKY